LLIKDISLKVSKGKTLAIVGNSGNGKSTLVKLLSKFYHPTSGDILVNGESIKTLDERVVRSFFSIVPQSLSLFNNSFKYNIKYGNPNASDEEMIEAAKKAQIHEMIINQPDGYDTKVGGSGLTLSGGEMQRIALARVFLKDSPVIILDEATSSLDNITENLLQKALKNLSREKKTMVIIAHR
ncbi:ABC transporter-like protein, partial [Neoconidiobolus thromboides FSU 785]